MYHDQQTRGSLSTAGMQHDIAQQIRADRHRHDDMADKIRAANEHEKKVAREMIGFGALDNIKPAPPASALEDALGGVHKSVSELGACVDHLSTRLSNVLQPSAPTPVSAGQCASNAALPRSPAVNDIGMLRLRIHSLIEQVSDLSSRLDT